MKNDNNSFYNDQKFCPTCDEYVSYLSSPVQCYCVQCGGEARIMSPEDWAIFNHGRAKPTRRGKGKTTGTRTQTTQVQAQVPAATIDAIPQQPGIVRPEPRKQGARPMESAGPADPSHKIA